MKKNYLENYFYKYSEILLKFELKKLLEIARLINETKLKKKKLL